MEVGRTQSACNAFTPQHFVLLDVLWKAPARINVAEVKLSTGFQAIVHTLDDLGLGRAQVDDAVACGNINGFVLNASLWHSGRGGMGR